MLSKGEETKRHIVESAYAQARAIGLEGLTIGQLAASLQMSKSGLFAHFGSKEDLQLAVLAHATEQFLAEVLRPSIAAEKGLKRISKVFELWVTYSAANETQGGCLFIAAAADFDDKPGPIRDYLSTQQSAWRESLQRMVLDAQRYGDLPKETDAKQMAFELFSLVLGCHHDRRLLNDREAINRANVGLKRLIANPPQVSVNP